MTAGPVSSWRMMPVLQSARGCFAEAAGVALQDAGRVAEGFGHICGCWAEDAERGWRAAQRDRAAFLPGEIRWDRLVSFGKVKAGRDYAWLRWMNCGRLGENKGINRKIWALGKKDGFLLDQISRRASQEEEKGLENCF